MKKIWKKKCYLTKGIDLVDVCVVVRSWVRGLFVTYNFATDFVLRVLDLIFLEGPCVLFSIVYGCVRIFLKQEILESISDSEIFGAIGKCPTFLDTTKLDKTQLIEKMISYAQSVFELNKFSYFTEAMTHKNWDLCLQIPGISHFYPSYIFYVYFISCLYDCVL